LETKSLNRPFALNHLKLLSKILNFEVNPFLLSSFVIIMSFMGLNWYLSLNSSYSNSILNILFTLSSILIELVLIAFLIYMPFVLIINKYWGWVISFVIFFAMPTAFLFLFASESIIANLAQYLSLALLLLFCFFLRLSIGEKLKELQTREFYNKQRAKRSNEIS